jgi:hypothetical protein
MKAGKIKMVICVQLRNDEQVPFAHCTGLDRSMILNSTNEKVLCFQNSSVMVRSHYDPGFCKQDEEVLQALEAIGSILIYSHTRILYASIDSGCLCLLLLGRYPGARRIGNADQLQPLLRRLNLVHLPNVPKELCLSYASSHHQRYSFTNYQVILILACRS